MTPDAFRTALADRGLTQLSFARFLDIDERTVRRWAKGEIPVPRSVAYLLELMQRYGVGPDGFQRHAAT